MLVQLGLKVESLLTNRARPFTCSFLMLLLVECQVSLKGKCLSTIFALVRSGCYVIGVLLLHVKLQARLAFEVHSTQPTLKWLFFSHMCSALVLFLHSFRLKCLSTILATDPSYNIVNLCCVLGPKGS